MFTLMQAVQFSFGDAGGGIDVFNVSVVQAPWPPHGSDAPPHQFVWRVYALVASDGQLQAMLESQGSDYAPLCRTLRTAGDTAAFVLEMDAANTTASLHAPAPGGVFHFLLLLCIDEGRGARAPPSHVRVSAAWHLTNDWGREELGAGAIPLKVVPAVAMGAWAGAAAGLGAGMVYAAGAHAAAGGAAADGDGGGGVEAAVLRPVRALHATLFAVALLHAGASCVVWRYYLDTSATGVDDEAFEAGAAVSTAAALTALLGVLLLVARGWQVTRLGADASGARQVALLCALYMVTWTLWSLQGGFLFLCLVR